jgi:hypothetical protein
MSKADTKSGVFRYIVVVVVVVEIAVDEISHQNIVLVNTWL